MQFFDLYHRGTGDFIMRAELLTIRNVYAMHRAVEQRVAQSGNRPLVLFGNGRHADLTLVPVASFTPPPMPDVAS